VILGQNFWCHWVVVRSEYLHDPKCGLGQKQSHWSHVNGEHWLKNMALRDKLLVLMRGACILDCDVRAPGRWCNVVRNVGKTWTAAAGNQKHLHMPHFPFDTARCALIKTAHGVIQ